VELLAIRCRENKEIKGLEVTFGKIIKILMYADDITVFLKDHNDVRIVINTINEFSAVSGLTLNKNKSEAMGIGSSKNICKTNNLNCVQEIKILGIYFNNTFCASENEKNWRQRIDTLKSLIIQWEKRNLGIMSKICITKSLLLSQLIYVIQAISLPERVLKEVNTLLYRFIWRKKDCNRRAFEKVKRVVINSDTEKGGIKMIDIQIMQESFTCERITKILDENNNSKWTWIPKLHLKLFGINYACLSLTVGPKLFKGLSKVTSVYWKRALTTWLTLNKISPFYNGSKICIWNNAKITYQNKVLMFENWINKVTYLNDILQNGVIFNFETAVRILGHSPQLFLEYLVVRNAVTGYITQHGTHQTHYNKLFSKKLVHGNNRPNAKIFRQYIVNNRYSPPCAIRFWKHRFNFEVGQYTWELARNTTQEVRLRELQWKILHNIYPTNILLHKIGKAENIFCTLCTHEIDYIEHFFFLCPHIKPLWLHITNSIQRRLDKKITFTAEIVLLGIDKKNDFLLKSNRSQLNKSPNFNWKNVHKQI